MNDLSPVVLYLRAFTDLRNREFWPLCSLLTKQIQNPERKHGQRFTIKIDDPITSYRDESEKEAYLVIAASLSHPHDWEFEWVVSIEAFTSHFKIVCAVDVMGDNENGEAECRDAFLESTSVRNIEQTIKSTNRLSKRVCTQTRFLDLFLRPTLSWQDFPLLKQEYQRFQAIQHYPLSICLRNIAKSN